jgi:hypothetical protein
VQWKQELRDDILRVHAMAHTVINDAPLSHPPGKALSAPKPSRTRVRRS